MSRGAPRSRPNRECCQQPWTLEECSKHTGLHVAVQGRRRRGPSIRAKYLRANNTMLFIEEIVIVSSKPLHSINLQSNVISCGTHVYHTRCLSRDSARYR